MVSAEHGIVGQVYAAKEDTQAADTLIRQYMGFIRSQVVKFVHAAPEDGFDDELSIAMMAFYEAILSYEHHRGAFLSYAARAIRSRLIDHHRSQKRHSRVLSLHAPAGDGEDRALLDTIPDSRDHIEELHARAASAQEIQEFGRQLERFGIRFSDVADNCPRQERTFAACRRVLDYARGEPALLRRLEQTGRLPMEALAQGTGVERKTLERHRKYLVALLLAFTNGYEIIRGHLCRIGKGGDRA